MSLHLWPDLDPDLCLTDPHMYLAPMYHFGDQFFTILNEFTAIDVQDEVSKFMLLNAQFWVFDRVSKFKVTDRARVRYT